VVDVDPRHHVDRGFHAGHHPLYEVSSSQLQWRDIDRHPEQEFLAIEGARASTIVKAVSQSL
jgi:hypothetical protein